MVGRYTLFQREAGLVGAPGKLSLTDSKVEEKQNKDPNKQKRASFWLFAISTSFLPAVHYLHKWYLPVSELFNVTEELCYWLLFQKRKDMWCWIQTCPAVLFCIKTSFLSLEILQVFSSTRLQIQKFEIWVSWDLSKMRWRATLLPLLHFNILLLSRSGIL